MFIQTAFLAIAVGLMLTGAWVQWRSSWYQMDAEEDMKDKKLTQDQVHQRIRMIRWSGFALTAAGIVLLIAGLIIGSQ